MLGNWHPAAAEASKIMDGHAAAAANASAMVCPGAAQHFVPSLIVGIGVLGKVIPSIVVVKGLFGKRISFCDRMIGALLGLSASGARFSARGLSFTFRF